MPSISTASRRMEGFTKTILAGQHPWGQPPSAVRRSEAPQPQLTRILYCCIDAWDRYYSSHFRGGASCCRRSRSFTSSAAAPTPSGCGSSLSAAGSARWFTSSSRPFPTPVCCASLQSLSRGASASANWKPPFWTILPPEITKNWPTCTSRKASSRGPAKLTTRRFPRAPTRPIPFYRRAVAAIQMGDFAAAAAGPGAGGVGQDPTYDFHGAAGLLAHAYANTGQPDEAAALFQEVTKISTSSETYYNYACFLASQQRNAEAREWAQQILAKKPTMPGYLRRRERPWFRKARTALLKSTLPRI